MSKVISKNAFYPPTIMENFFWGAFIGGNNQTLGLDDEGGCRGLQRLQGAVGGCEACRGCRGCIGL